MCCSCVGKLLSSSASPAELLAALDWKNLQVFSRLRSTHEMASALKKIVTPVTTGARLMSGSGGSATAGKHGKSKSPT